MIRKKKSGKQWKRAAEAGGRVIRSLRAAQDHLSRRRIGVSGICLAGNFSLKYVNCQKVALEKQMSLGYNNTR